MAEATADLTQQTQQQIFRAWAHYRARAEGCVTGELHSSQQQQGPIWEPQEGVQAAAYESQADVLGYGGAAGGGKSQLALGLAITKHRRSIYYRQIMKSLSGIIEDSEKVLTRPGDDLNRSTHTWRTEDGRRLEFAQVQHEKDKKKYQGIPHDLMVFDEAAEFPETVIRFLMGWNRSAVPGQHCQVVLTFNPPMDDAGDWITTFFGPWLDPDHHRPAKDGELRWYARVDDEDYPLEEEELRWFLDDGLDLIEVPSGEPVRRGKHLMRPMRGAWVNGKAYLAKSRTFFHASLKDNPILAASGYGATIDAMPEPLRSLLKGQFDAGRVTDPWQVIPGDWVRLANKRWEQLVADGVEMPGTTPCDTLAVDVARGGKDKTTIARRYGTWFAPLLKVPGRSTPNGPAVASLVLNQMEPGATVHIDAIGVGTSPLDILEANEIDVVPIVASEGTKERDKSGKLAFRNLRAEMWWKMRETLDPANGDNIALPPDPELLADLCAPRWSLSTAGILIESKDDIKERLGRSTDCADAVVMANWRRSASAAISTGAKSQTAKDPVTSIFKKLRR